jgi:hypothetical protein
LPRDIWIQPTIEEFANDFQTAKEEDERET